jgi:hypothetical protein
MAHCSANAIVTRIAAADDDDIFPFGIDVVIILQLRIKERCGVELD